MFIALAASAVTASVAFFACTRVVDSAIPLKWRDPVSEIYGSFAPNAEFKSTVRCCTAAGLLCRRLRLHSGHGSVAHRWRCLCFQGGGLSIIELANDFAF